MVSSPFARFDPKDGSQLAPAAGVGRSVSRERRPAFPAARAVLFLASALALAAFALVSARPAAALPPHVAAERDTDACAMCHRAHTATGDVVFPASLGSTATSSALLIRGETDRDLCFTCHGVDAIGSEIDVQTDFEAISAHLLAPLPSAYGPSPKQCGACHDVHGSERTASGTPYPALLRVESPTRTQVFSGEEFCACCHADREEDRWDGLAVFSRTAHSSAITEPATGTGIVCTVCHAPHGSDNPPLVADTVFPPSAAATVSVPANDRRLCFACHSGELGTYEGTAAYQVSSHGMTSKGVSVTGEWVSAETTRPVGECQVCHSPMGRSDGTTDGVLPKLLELTQPALCLTCHTADGPASVDATTFLFPVSAAGGLELVAGFRPAEETSPEARLALYSRDTTGAAPRDLVGPREYAVGGRVSSLSAGDIDGDGVAELVVADETTAALRVYSYSPLRGISDRTGPGRLAIASAADLVVVADMDDAGLPEIAVVDADASTLRVYRYSGSGLDLLDTVVGVGTGPSSIGSGDCTGTSGADVVVTADDGTFAVVTMDAGGNLQTSSHPARGLPRGVSVGDAWEGGTKDEIVMANAGETTGTVSVYRGDGSSLGDFDDGGPWGGVPQATAIADVLPGFTAAGTSGKEVVVALGSSGATSGLNVFKQTSGGGLSTPQVYSTGSFYDSGSLICGDVEGDGRTEAVVGNGGKWLDKVTLDHASPSLQVFRPDTDGTALVIAATLWGGGVEEAGYPPALALADLGAVGPSRHAVGSVPGAHVATETSVSLRHVECTDCHDVHEATSAVAAAPAVPGRLKGSWGVAVTNQPGEVSFTLKRVPEYEYEVCFKCHSSWSVLGGSRDIAYEFNPYNASAHAVETVSVSSRAATDSFVSGWDNASVMYCGDCHGGSSSGEPSGTHVSRASPLLRSPYAGTRASDAALLCYRCHRQGVYHDGGLDAGDSASRFRTSLGGRLHYEHTARRGFGCASCHLAHGSPLEHYLLRSDVGFEESPTGGECGNACHGGSALGYSRP